MTKYPNSSPRIALFGAAPDTPNMGVSALFVSTLSGLKERLPSAEFVVFDNGLGHRRDVLHMSNNRQIPYQRFGARAGKRYTRPENLATMNAMASLGWLGRKLNGAIDLIDSCDTVLDVSGGDSFSDIYGVKRFFSVARPKLIALKRRIPLILLPQTYGPFSDSGLRGIAAGAVRGSEMAWARDQHSFSILKSLLGDKFDAERHKCGVDLAFGLETRQSLPHIGETLRHWINDGTSSPIVGFNINGLIFNNPEKAKSQYDFKADYAEAISIFLKWLIDEKKARIVLTPHVMDEIGHYESDYEASVHVTEELGEGRKNNVTTSPTKLDQSQVKWLISKMDWFCGTRMHSTIAALSSGVPTASIAYSDKTKGVFETCGQSQEVVDPRSKSTEEIVEFLKSSFENRAETGLSLQKNMLEIRKIASDQLDFIAQRISRYGEIKMRRLKGPN